MKIESQGQVHIVRWPNPITEADLNAFQKAIDPVFDQGSPMVLIHDTSKGQTLTSVQRKKITEAQNQHFDRVSRVLRCAIIVTTHNAKAMEAAATAISWFSKFPSPIKFVNSEEDALKLAKTYLKPQ